MKKRINYLLQKFEADQLSGEEKEEILSYVNQFPELFQSEILEMILVHQAPDGYVDHGKWDQVLGRVFSVDKTIGENRLSLSKILKWSAAAAVFVGLLFTAYYNLTKPHEHIFASDVNPGGNEAVLVLANGKKVSLSGLKQGEQVQESGFSISKAAGGRIIYDIKASDSKKTDTGTNTIITPKGGEWEVHLADGSVVWLNAASSLTYPLNVASAPQRKVQLKGEAYFEVAKDTKRPFIVHTAHQELQVLGTHFNVNGYPDESDVRTTLLEGSVKVSAVAGGTSAVLRPGEQSLLSLSGIDVRNVNPDESIAWKNGYFMFNNERQESILRKISRWYNVEIEYADPTAKDVMYYGTVSRFEKISKVLRKFEQTGEVRFDIQARKVIVYKK